MQRFVPQRDLRRLLQAGLGLRIIGEAADAIFILYGIGDNGKTTLFNIEERVIGDDYVCEAPDGLLKKRKNDEHPTLWASVRGKRGLRNGENDQGVELSPALIKRVCHRTINARFMRGNFFTFTNTATLFLDTNDKPDIRAFEHGTWKRLKLVPFEVQIPAHEKDSDFADKLSAEEAEGILAQYVRWARQYYKHGKKLPESQTSQDATDEYRSALDVVGAFIRECCERGQQYEISVHEAYAAYVVACDAILDGATPQSKNGFMKELRNRKLVKKAARKRMCGPFAQMYTVLKLNELGKKLAGCVSEQPPEY
jgi:putative DNA primase/helicase